MKKWLKLISGILIIGLIVLSYVPYQNNSRLKNALGLTYLSNITNFKQHITHVEYYLQNEKEFQKSDLSYYYDEVNHLMITTLPSDNYIQPYIGFIQHNIQEISDLISKGASENEIKIVRENTLQLLNALNDGLEKMAKAGYVEVGQSTHIDYKRYYQLSESNNKIMESININLEKQIKKQIDFLNKQ